MIKKYPIVTICLALILLFVVGYYFKNPLVTQVEIRGTRFTVDLAVTPEEQERGLGYRDSLPDNHGMLFLYQGKDRYGYWMKGMRFPIDIIWIRDQNIIDISKNVPVATGSSLPTYTPKEVVNKVLEVNAGTVDRLGIQIGDVVSVVH
jgi:uncharacterized membrane protein (UPF0127 family)